MALAVTDPPHREETILLFTFRLTVVNGVGRIANICAYLGLDLKGLVQGKPSQIQRLAGPGGVDEAELADRAFRLSDDGFDLYRDERLAHSPVHRRRLRACPLCIMEDRSVESEPIFRPLQSLKHARTCFHHKAALVDPTSTIALNDFVTSWRGQQVSSNPA